MRERNIKYVIFRGNLPCHRTMGKYLVPLIAWVGVLAASKSLDVICASGREDAAPRSHPSPSKKAILAYFIF